MSQEKTFEAINKLKEVELELHRLKNALELANKGLESERTWVGLTEDEVMECLDQVYGVNVRFGAFAEVIEAKLKEKNT